MVQWYFTFEISIQYLQIHGASFALKAVQFCEESILSIKH